MLARQLSLFQRQFNKFSSTKSDQQQNNSEDISSERGSRRSNNKTQKKEESFKFNTTEASSPSQQQYEESDQPFQQILDEYQTRKAQIKEYESFEQNLHSENEFNGDKEQQSDNVSHKKSQSMDEEVENLDLSTMSEFDQQYYNTFEKCKKQRFHQLTDEEINGIGEEFNQLIAQLMQINESEIFNQVNKQQLLIMRLYSDWAFATRKRKYFEEHQAIINKEKMNIDEQEKVINQQEELINKQISYISNILLTPNSVLPSKYPKEYFSCVLNYANKLFTPIQCDILVHILKKNLELIPIIELVKLSAFFPKLKDQFISEILIKMPKATILEFSYIQELFKLPEVKSNLVFTDSYLTNYSPHWKQMNAYQIIGVAKVLSYFTEKDFSKYYYFFEEIIVRNIMFFTSHHIKYLLQFYKDLQAKSKTMYQNPITHDLNSRKILLKIKKGMQYLEYHQQNGVNITVSKKIVTTLKEYVKIANEIEYFRYSYGLPKSQTNYILKQINDENPKFETYRSIIKEYQIENFELYSTLLFTFEVKDLDIIACMGKQYEEKYPTLELSLESEILIFINFMKLSVKYPYIKELQQKFLENIDEYDFKDSKKAFLGYELVCLCSLYETNIDLVNKIEKKLIENSFLSSMQQSVDYTLELATHLPQATFKVFINSLINQPSTSFQKKTFYKYIYILTQQQKINVDFISNQLLLNVFNQSKKIFYNSIKYTNNQSVLSLPEQELYLILTTAAQKYFPQHNIKIIPKPHFVHTQRIQYLIQNTETSFHLDLIQKHHFFINKLNTLTPLNQSKSLYLKQLINYEYVSFIDFCMKDRDELAKNLLAKYFK